MSYQDNIPDEFKHNGFAPFNFREEDDFMLDDDGNIIIDDVESEEELEEQYE